MLSLENTHFYKEPVQSGHASEAERPLTDQTQAAFNWYTNNFLMVNK